VDKHSLRLLANGGFGALPATELPALSSWCWDFGLAAADARYFVLSRIFCVIHEAFGDAEHLKPTAYDSLDGTLVRLLPAIIDEPDVSSATSLAGHLLEDVMSALRT
jgi:hypothetical protein